MARNSRRLGTSSGENENAQCVVHDHHALSPAPPATNGTTAGDTIWTRFSDIMADVYGSWSVSPPSWRSLQLALHCCA